MKCCEHAPWGCIHCTYFPSYLMNRSTKLECFITLGWKGLSEKNNLTYCASSQVTDKMKCCEYAPRGCIHCTNFSLYLMTRPNKLDSSIRLSWKGLSETNTLTYCASSWVTNKMKCCEYAPWGQIHNTSSYLANRVNKLSVKLTGKACQSQMHWLIEPICKLKLK
jgi:hypothetical protein